MEPRVTVSMPVFERPQRTQRMIKALLGQTVSEWEAFIIGDCCPYFDQHKELLQDPRIWSWNQPVNGGGWGYKITNTSIRHASGKYFMFLANDDMISPYHLQNYLKAIEGTDYDFVYFDSWVLGHYTKYKIKRGHIGDNAVIIRTEFLKQMPARRNAYGHDWELIEDMILCGAKYRKSKSNPTYHIMTSPTNRIDPEGID